MSRALLDVNVLLALFDSDHVDHGRAHEWLDAEIDEGWASCPITQNGFVRIISQPRYPSPIPVAEAMSLLDRACDDRSHEFWPCDISLLDDRQVDGGRLLGHHQLTDAYLLALATARSARFATFDSRLSLSVVPAATGANLTVL